MTKKEFLKLADKYERNIISEKEKDLLFHFCDQTQLKNNSDAWDISQDVESQIKVFNRVLRSTRLNDRKKSKTQLFKLLRNTAAIVIAVGLGAIIYYQISPSIQNAIPSDAVTITLEDGTIQVLEENGSNILTSKNGLVIGKQHSGKLIYNKNNFSNGLQYNTINVPYGKSFEVQFSDGSTAYLNAGTSIRYPVQFLENYNRTIFVNGEVFLNVSKDKSHPFIVKSNNLDIKVLGTQFNLNSYKDEATAEVILLEGSVSLQNNTDQFKKTTILKPGQLASITNKSTLIDVREVHAENYIKWITGELVFKNMPFETILKKLERHYNYSIINKNPETNQIIFNASFGTASIEMILKSLKENYGINYKIENRTITIY